MTYFAIVGYKGEYFGAPFWMQSDSGGPERIHWNMPEGNLPAEWMPKRSLSPRNDGGYVLVPEHMLLKWLPELGSPAWKHSFLLCAASGRGRSKPLAFGHAFREARLLEIIGVTDRLACARAYARVLKRTSYSSPDKRISKAISALEDFSDAKIDERPLAKFWSEAQDAMNEGIKHLIWTTGVKALWTLVPYLIAGTAVGYVAFGHPILGFIVGLVVFGLHVAFSSDPTLATKRTYAQFWLFEAERRLSDLRNGGFPI